MTPWLILLIPFCMGCGMGLYLRYIEEHCTPQEAAYGGLLFAAVLLGLALLMVAS